MGRLGYQALGFAVWRIARWYLRRRFGDTPRRVALGALLLAALGVAIAARRA